METNQDANGTWHARDLKKGGRDNNILIYGSVAKYLGLDVSKYPAYFKQCKVSVSAKNIKFKRHPDMDTPPPSPEEFIGALVLGLIPYKTAKSNHFMFYGKGKPARVKDLETIASGLLKLYVAHQINVFMPDKKKVKQRNLFWKHNIEELYGLAFRLNPAFIYCVKKANGVKPHEEERLLFKLHCDVVLSKSNKKRGDLSQKMILWVLAKYMRSSSLAKKCKPEVIIPAYFGKNHVFSHKIRSK